LAAALDRAFEGLAQRRSAIPGSQDADRAVA